MKSERFEMRLDSLLAERIDSWRDGQSDQPSRSEAARRLIDVGLSVCQPKAVFPDNSEKLMMVMLCDLLRHHGINREVDPDFLMDVIVGGHYWALSWELDGLFHGGVDAPQAVGQVVDILDMWSFIEEAIESLNNTQVAKLKSNPDIVRTRFPGFDGNEEIEHRSIAKFMVDRMGRFSRFRSHETGMNAHHSTLARHLQMFDIFKSIRPKLIGRRMSMEELEAVLTV